MSGAEVRRGRCASRQKALGKTCRLNAQLTVNPPVSCHRRRAERRVVDGVLGAPPMAKKADEDAPEADAEDAPQADAVQGGGKKKLILFGAVGLVALGLIGGGGYFFFLRGKTGEATEQAVVEKPVGFVEVREMTVNLAPDSPQDRARLLKFKVSLEVKDPKIIPEIQPLMPRVEDSFQVYVRELRASDLEGSAGLYRLREELLRVNYAVYPAKVDAVLFKDIVVQ